MNRFFAGLAAAFAIVAPLSATADTITLSAPLMGASLHEGEVNMNVYYTAESDDGFEVVATYADATTPADAARLRMRLADGNSVHFGLPGHAGTIYSFQRSGTTVTVGAEPAATTAASPES